MSFIYALSATWNDIGSVFNGIELNVSNGAGGSPVYAAGSKVLRLQNDGTDVFTVDPLGAITAAGVVIPSTPATAGYALIGNSASAATFQGYTNPGTGGVARTWPSKVGDIFSVKDFGAVGNDSSADIIANNTAFAAAIAACIANGGGTILFPRGVYQFNSTMLIDGTTWTFLGTKRVTLRGEGVGATQLHFVSSTPSDVAVKFLGANLSVLGGISDMTIYGGSISGQVGLWLQGVGAGFFIEDVTIYQFFRGLYQKDTVGIYHKGMSIQFCSQGFYGDGVFTYSPPNEDVWIGCHISANSQYGFWLNVGSPTTFIGGSIEENGNFTVTGGTAADRWGIRVTNVGFNGGTGLTIMGTHFEGNANDADIWLDHDSSPCAYNIISCDFFRTSNTPADYVTNNIRFDTTGVSKAEVVVKGCGFIGVNGYVESASRLYIAAVTVAGTKHTFHFDGNMYNDTTALPIVQPVTIQHDAASFGFAISTYHSGALVNGFFYSYDGSGNQSFLGNFQNHPLNLLVNNATVIGITSAGATVTGTLAASSLITGYNATATPAAATAKAMIAGGTALVGVYWGTGDPNGQLTAPRGSLYTRTDGGTNTSLYLNSDSGTTWKAVTSA